MNLAVGCVLTSSFFEGLRAGRPPQITCNEFYKSSINFWNRLFDFLFSGLQLEIVTRVDASSLKLHMLQAIPVNLPLSRGFIRIIFRRSRSYVGI